MGYKVKLDVFEGPFDLLVYLIENAQMNIYDINVTEIANQYTSYIEKAKAFDIALASEFLVLAASLVEIKSKMLLPRAPAPEGLAEPADPRSELVSRLLEYKRFKNAAQMLERAEERAMYIFEKPQEDLARYTNEPDVYLSADIKYFVKAFDRFLQKKKKVEEIQKNYTKPEKTLLTIEEKEEFIQKIFKVKNKRTVNFRELLLREGDRYETVVTFSTVLEMARQKTIEVRQPVAFGDIEVTEGFGEGGEHGRQENDKISL